MRSVEIFDMRGLEKHLSMPDLRLMEEISSDVAVSGHRNSSFAVRMNHIIAVVTAHFECIVHNLTNIS